MAQFKTDASTILDVSRIETVSDNGAGGIVLTAFGGSYVVTCADSLAGFQAKAATVQVTANLYVPVAAIASVVALLGGAAQVTPMSGRVLTSTLTFSAISTALSPQTP
jgi:hypothetical protein